MLKNSRLISQSEILASKSLVQVQFSFLRITGGINCSIKYCAINIMELAVIIKRRLPITSVGNPLLSCPKEPPEAWVSILLACSTSRRTASLITLRYSISDISCLCWASWGFLGSGAELLHAPAPLLKANPGLSATSLL